MHSLRPHNHRGVHLTVMQWTRSPKRPRNFWSFTNRLFCRERYFRVATESDWLVFSFGAKEQSIPWRFRLTNYSERCATLWLSVSASYTQTTPTPKSHYRQTKQSTVRSTNSNDTSAAHTIRSAHRQFIRRRAWNRRNNRSQEHDHHNFLSTQADNGVDRKLRISIH